jgi:hypothetical protein
MKKRFIIFVLLSVVFVLAACSSGVSQEKYDALEAQLKELQEQITSEADDPDDEPAVVTTESPTSAPMDGFDSAEVLTQLERTEYIIHGKYYDYSAIVIKNNSDYDLAMRVSATFYDDEGNIVGTASKDENAVESGYEVAFDFINEERFSAVEYDISVDEEMYYDSVLSSLSLDVSTTKSKAIVSVTNNGTVPAEFVEFIVIYFNGDKPVAIGSGYCVDSDYAIKPGATQRGEDTPYVKFNSVKVYLTGRASL